ncbi:MAG TPA: thioredoxin family protein [Legionellaceae bacterium]|nr:thioredoxin family protein [Legionellaceae bacterium]
MVKKESAMLPLGTLAPSFALTDVSTNQLITLDTHKGRVATIIAFICNHCPYVKHINQELPRLVADFKDKGVELIAINANDAVQYPDDAPENMKVVAKQLGYNFPYLYDDTQEVALAYNAQCTPDFFVFDKDLRLVYRGQLDDSRIGNGLPVTGASIRSALTQVLNNQPISADQKPSIGCSIKWIKN